MRTKCPHCQATFKVKDELTGRGAACAICHQKFVIEPIAEAQTGDTLSRDLLSQLAQGPADESVRGRRSVPATTANTRARQAALQTTTARTGYAVSEADPEPPPLSQAAAPKAKPAGFRLPFIRAILATLAFAVVFFFALAMLPGVLQFIDKTKSLAPDVNEVEVWKSALRNLVASSLLHSGLLCAAVIVFWTWKYRAYKNLYALGAQQLRYSPGGSIGWYFCPILHLWRPMQAMEDIYVNSRPRNTPASAGLVGLWWGLWVAPWFLSIFSKYYHPTSTSFAEAKGQIILKCWLLFAVEISHAACAAVTVLLIWIVMANQRKRSQKTLDKEFHPSAGR